MDLFSPAGMKLFFSKLYINKKEVSKERMISKV